MALDHSPLVKAITAVAIWEVRARLRLRPATTRAPATASGTCKMALDWLTRIQRDAQMKYEIEDVSDAGHLGLTLRWLSEWGRVMELRLTSASELG